MNTDIVTKCWVIVNRHQRWSSIMKSYTLDGEVAHKY